MADVLLRGGSVSTFHEVGWVGRGLGSPHLLIRGVHVCRVPGPGWLIPGNAFGDRKAQGIHNPPRVPSWTSPVLNEANIEAFPQITFPTLGLEVLLQARPSSSRAALTRPQLHTLCPHSAKHSRVPKRAQGAPSLLSSPEQPGPSPKPTTAFLILWEPRFGHCPLGTAQVLEDV